MRVPTRREAVIRETEDPRQAGLLQTELAGSTVSQKSQRLLPRSSCPLGFCPLQPLRVLNEHVGDLSKQGEDSLDSLWSVETYTFLGAHFSEGYLGLRRPAATYTSIQAPT